MFRFETFGNERFATGALRLPQGLAAAGTTPRQLLALGVNVDADALTPALRQSFVAGSAGFLDDPAMLAALFNANAVVGLPAKDTNGDGTIDVARGDLVGVACAVCHTRAEEGVIFRVAGAGAVGRRQDGLATHDLDWGRLMSLASNSRALYPLLQLSLTANGGATLGRATRGLTENSTEPQPRRRAGPRL